MEMSRNRKLTWFLIWIVTIPISLHIAVTYFPSNQFDWVNIGFLSVILLGTMLLPIKIQDVNISLERWLTFTVFLQYGVFAELVFMQVALLILLIGSKSTMPFLSRLFFNSSMFAAISIISGGVFHLAGGEIGSRDLSSILLYGLLYAATYAFFNNIILKIYFQTMDKNFSLVKIEAQWDYIMTMIMLPFSLTLYILYDYIGNKAIFLVCIPTIIILFALRKYTKSNDLNDKLVVASDIGHDLAEQLRFDEVMETFIVKLKDVVAYDYAYVIDYEKKEYLIPLGSIEDGSFSNEVKDIVIIPLRSAHSGLDFNRTQFFYNRKEIEQLKGMHFLTDVESVMTVPIKRNGSTEGFLILTSTLKNSFRSSDEQIIDILVSYFAISLQKARYFEETLENNERCALTKLHNFRYLEKKLMDEMNRYHVKEITSLSAIILDIDYFKKVNDMYGHESGNMILVELSQILQKFMKPGETLARYGGEEFVLILPNETKVKASERAEAIRAKVERTSFTIIPDLLEDRVPIDIQITASFGVATLPKDGKDTTALMRNADSALYIGGKQAGRNRVGIYGEEAVIGNS